MNLKTDNINISSLSDNTHNSHNTDNPRNSNNFDNFHNNLYVNNSNISIEHLDNNIKSLIRVNEKSSCYDIRLKRDK